VAVKHHRFLGLQSQDNKKHQKENVAMDKNKKQMIIVNK